MENKKIQIVECPRDAMQGINKFIANSSHNDYSYENIQVANNISRLFLLSQILSFPLMKASIVGNS